MRTQRPLRPRAALAAFGALSFTIPMLAAAPPAPAQSDTQGASAPAREKVYLGVAQKRLNVNVGRRAVVAGTLSGAPKRTVVVLERRSGKRWQRIARTRTSSTGRYRVSYLNRRTERVPVRVRAAGGVVRASRSLGRMRAFRSALASWYGPGFYGRRTACGQTFRASLKGVAHKRLPCGTAVTFRKGKRIVRARVIDRGPFVGAREFDLSPAVKRALGFGSTGRVRVAH